MLIVQWQVRNYGNASRDGERGRASLKRGSGAEPPAESRGRGPGQVVKELRPSEAERLLAFGHPTEAANLPYSLLCSLHAMVLH